jgi:hypothetical protein
MRKLIVPSLLALCLSAGALWAQNITSSLQGSQDPRGPVGVDTSSNLYAYNHLNFLGNRGVAPTVAGATTLSTNTDNQGVIATTTTSATVTFGTAFLTAPACVLQELAGATAPTFTTYTTGFYATTIVNTKSYSYLCFSND